jgi:hypothetical protein
MTHANRSGSGESICKSAGTWRVIWRSCDCDIDFTGAKQGAVLPLEAGKTKISIRLDNKVIEDFRAQVERAGTGSYQTLINDALVAFIQQRSMIDAVRQVVREELASPQRKLPRPSKRLASA